jgi:dihydrofolate synthase/folylpolyglutamate synthase
MCSPSANLDPDSRMRESALRFLDARINYERIPSAPYRTQELKLERMRQLLARLDNPHDGLPCVHIAGTKGKGSTAAMTGGVLSASGYRTGVFTSPHLDRIEERLAIDGAPCSASELAELVREVAPAVEAMDRTADTGPTYFEVVTAMAMVHFARRGVDVAVLEVGLGGRLDATNVCLPMVCAITSIGFDHTKQLGNTLRSIAREKAGIVKSGRPVVSGVVNPEPRDVIRRICKQRRSRLVELDVDFRFEYFPPRQLELAPAAGKMDFHCLAPNRQRSRQCLSLALLGRHQAANAAVTLAVLGELEQEGWKIPDSAIRSGSADTVWPARVEILARRPAIVLDSAHNPSSIEALVRVLDESFSARRRLLVFATTKGKDVASMLRRLLGCFDEVIFTQYLNNPRAVPASELAAMAAEMTGGQFRVCPRPAAAWDEVRSLATPDDLICVTGSFFIAAEMRQEIWARPAPIPTAGIGCDFA